MQSLCAAFTLTVFHLIYPYYQVFYLLLIPQTRFLKVTALILQKNILSHQLLISSFEFSDLFTTLYLVL